MTPPESADAVTQALHERIDNAKTHPVVTPLYQASAFKADSPYFYTRHSNPNFEELERVVARFEECSHALSVTTGMAAISIVCRLLRPGDHLVVNSLIYGCSYKYFQRLQQSLGLRLTVLDLTERASLDRLPSDVGMVVLETPTNPFLKTIDIAAVAARTKSLNPSALVVVDNTWATPVFQQPLQHGADISLYSATKYFSGHSDVMGGVVAVDRDDLAEQLREERFYSGAILDPHSAWLLRRSMQTFALRMQAHQQSTAALAQWLRTTPQIKQVYLPTVNGEQLRGYGGIVFCSLRDDLAARYTEFAQALKWFDTGTGMACVTSMVAQPFSGSHASLSSHEKTQMGIDQGLVRLCFGLESVDDLKNDLRRALQQIDRQRQREETLRESA